MKRTFFYLLLILLVYTSCHKSLAEGKPVASFSWTPSTLTAPVTVTFKSNSINAKEFNWDFGDGNSSTLENPSNRYTTAGTYQVNLTVRNPSAPQNIQYATSTLSLTVR